MVVVVVLELLDVVVVDVAAGGEDVAGTQTGQATPRFTGTASAPLHGAQHVWPYIGQKSWHPHCKA